MIKVNRLQMDNVTCIVWSQRF